jgi:serine/threonine protein phosphatase PrpC
LQTSSQEWQVAEASEQGPVRDENQDRMCSVTMPSGRLHIVADGMGGHKGGALAAQLTIDGLRRVLEQAPAGISIPSLLRQAFEQTNLEVHRMAHSGDAETDGMGSTAVVLWIREQSGHIAHVGDSRAYLFRDGRLRRMTKDHTTAQKMVEAGILTPEQALDHPSASVLERAIGIRPAIEVDLTQIEPIQKGDGMLLCSDGLSGCVSDGEIEEILKSRLTATETVKRLVDIAIAKGSKDNITVQYTQYGQVPAKSAARVPPWATLAVVGAALLLGLIYFFFLHPVDQPQQNRETQKPAANIDGSTVREPKKQD